MKRKYYYIKVRGLMTRLEVYGDKTLFKYASRDYGIPCDPSNAFSHVTSNSGNEQNPR